jgi:hypothetical protein
VIVVATADFEVYHDVVGELRDRGLVFTTTEPGAAYPAETSVLLTGAGETVSPPSDDVPVVQADPAAPRAAVDEAVAALRDRDGRTVVGIDPGERPGIAVLVGDTVVAAFQVPADEVAPQVREEVAEAVNPVIRIGDGARLAGARIIDDLPDVPVELVDETGTTPHLGTGARGMDDVLAAVNIARRSGEHIESRTVEPSAGEIERIKARSREASETNRAINTELARQVASGELSLAEALTVHREDGSAE